LVIGRNRAAVRGGSFSSFHPAIVLAHSRARSLSVMPGNRWRSSTELATTIERSADRGSLFLGNDEHPARMEIQVANGK
jgi:hypothetical protein